MQEHKRNNREWYLRIFLSISIALGIVQELEGLQDKYL